MTKIQTPTQLMLVRMWKSKNPRLLFVGMQNGMATLENSMVVSYRTKHAFFIYSTYTTTWYLPKEIKNLCSLQHLHRHFQQLYPLTAQTWKQSRCHLAGEQIHCGTPKQWNIIQKYKAMGYQAIKYTEEPITK